MWQQLQWRRMKMRDKIVPDFTKDVEATQMCEPERVAEFRNTSLLFLDNLSECNLGVWSSARES